MNDKDLQNISSLLDEKLAVSEKRISDSLDKKLDEKLAVSEKRILNDIGDFVANNLLPQLGEKADKTDIDRLERKLDNFSGQVTANTQRLDDLESLPSIAHELKKKK